MRIKGKTVVFIWGLSFALLLGGAREALAQQLAYTGAYIWGVTVQGENTADHSTGVRGISTSVVGGWGVEGDSYGANGVGVAGNALAGGTGFNVGVSGQTYSTSGVGVYGLANAATGITYGVYGRNWSTSGSGVNGYAVAATGTTIGTLGRSDSVSGRGVFGLATTTTGSTFGVKGQSNSVTGYGVFGYVPASTGTGTGVLGQSNSPTGYGVYGHNLSGGYAGYFNGKVHVNGTLSKSAGSFKIDHPLDPKNKYLEHSFVESPDMMNIYNGNAILNEKGEGYVTMPDYFEALNRDFQYQLTSIGVSAPGLFIGEEIKGGKFKIAGGKPGMKVSWMVTGVRNDAYAQANRIQVVENKPEGERGKLMWPVASNQHGGKGDLTRIATAKAEEATNRH